MFVKGLPFSKEISHIHMESGLDWNRVNGHPVSELFDLMTIITLFQVLKYNLDKSLPNIKGRRHFSSQKSTEKIYKPHKKLFDEVKNLCEIDPK